jgi:hypothetical protein
MISGWKPTRELTRDVNAASDSNKIISKCQYDNSHLTKIRLVNYLPDTKKGIPDFFSAAWSIESE